MEFFAIDFKQSFMIAVVPYFRYMKFQTAFIFYYHLDFLFCNKLCIIENTIILLVFIAFTT